MWIEFNLPINFYFPIKRRILWEKFFFSINFLFETENGVKLRSRYLFFLVVIRLMAFMFVVMDSEGDFFSRRQSTSLTCIPWTAWSCKNYEQGDRKLSLFLENYFSFFVHLSVGCLFHVLVISEIFFLVDGWVGGLRNVGVCDMTYGLPLAQLMYSFIHVYTTFNSSSLFKNIWF